MPTPDPAIRDRKAWPGYVQGEGLVVPLAALMDVQIALDWNTYSTQNLCL